MAVAKYRLPKLQINVPAAASKMPAKPGASGLVNKNLVNKNLVGVIHIPKSNAKTLGESLKGLPLGRELDIYDSLRKK